MQREQFPLQVGPESIGWGILGTGLRAEQMVTEAIRQQPPTASQQAGSWVVGVYSHNERRAHAFAETHYIPHSFPNLADLLQRPEIQCVHVAGHPRHHHALTMAALAAGKHVLVEPPMALTLEQAQTLQQAAAYRKLMLAVNHSWRADPAVQHLKLLLADTFLGDLLGCHITNTSPLSRQQQSWRLQPNGGGVLLQRTYHDIDMIHYLLKDEVTGIYATGSQQIFGNRIMNSPEPGTGRVQPIEEEILSLVTLRRHPFTVQLHDSFFIPYLSSHFALYGSQATAQIQHWADSTRTSQLWIERNTVREQITLPTQQPDRQMIFAFHQHIQKQFQTEQPQQRSLLADGAASIQCLKVVTAARQSLWQQQLIAPVQ